MHHAGGHAAAGHSRRCLLHPGMLHDHSALHARRHLLPCGYGMSACLLARRPRCLGSPGWLKQAHNPNTPGWAEGRAHPESFLSSPPAQHARVRVPSHRSNRCASGCPASPPGFLTSERKTCMHVMPACPHPPATWAGLPSRVRATAAASCHCAASTARRLTTTRAASDARPT